MTGSAPLSLAGRQSGPGVAMPPVFSAGSTGAKHPLLLRAGAAGGQYSEELRAHSDQLRRLAFRNSFNSRRVGGVGVPGEASPSTPHPCTGRYLPAGAPRRASSLLAPLGVGARSAANNKTAAGGLVRLPPETGTLQPARLRGGASAQSPLARVVGAPCRADLNAIAKPSTELASLANNGAILNPTHPPRRLQPIKPRSPCSTTALDFHRHRGFHRSRATNLAGRCRANNPHPVGCVFQSPYNRHNKV